MGSSVVTGLLEEEEGRKLRGKKVIAWHMVRV
jgi:hypothetical protein